MWRTRAQNPTTKPSMATTPPDSNNNAGKPEPNRAHNEPHPVISIPHGFTIGQQLLFTGVCTFDASIGHVSDGGAQVSGLHQGWGWGVRPARCIVGWIKIHGWLENFIGMGQAIEESRFATGQETRDIGAVRSTIGYTLS